MHIFKCTYRGDLNYRLDLQAVPAAGGVSSVSPNMPRNLIGEREIRRERYRETARATGRESDRKKVRERERARARAMALLLRNLRRTESESDAICYAKGTMSWHLKEESARKGVACGRS